MIWILLALLFILYGISISYKNTGTNFFIIWFLFSAGCIGIYLFNIYSIWKYIPSFLLTMIGICLFLGCLVVGILLFKIASQFHKNGKPDLEYLIILGAQWKKTGPSKALRFRLDSAISYLKQNPNTICIVSGGQGYNEPISEAKGMASYLKEHGIENTVLEEDTSTSTLENIQNSMKYMNSYQSVGIVTNNFHLYRSLGIARKQGIQNVVGIAAPSTLWYQPNNILREVFGIVKDKLVHNM